MLSLLVGRWHCCGVLEVLRKAGAHLDVTKIMRALANDFRHIVCGRSVEVCFLRVVSSVWCGFGFWYSSIVPRRFVRQIFDQSGAESRSMRLNLKVRRLTEKYCKIGRLTQKTDHTSGLKTISQNLEA